MLLIFTKPCSLLGAKVRGGPSAASGTIILKAFDGHPMGNFSQLDDDDAELLSGGTKPANPSTAYNGSNYGQYLKSGSPGQWPNPGGKLGRNK